LKSLEAFDDAGVGTGRVQTVLVVVREENLEAAIAVGFHGVRAKGVGD
jgi:hypothetical protein